MASYQYSLIVLCCALSFFIIGCSDSEKQENIPNQPQNSSYQTNISSSNTPNPNIPESNVILPDETVPSTNGSNLVSQYTPPTNEASNLQKMHWDNEYEAIYQSSRTIDSQYSTIKTNAQRFLNNYNPGRDSIHKHKFMLVAVIASVASYWEDNTSQAREFAQKAFNYRDQSVDFPEYWKLQDWWQTKDHELANKLAQAKDFVLSCSNGGISNFEQANREFIARGQFSKGIEYYSQSLKMGLENSDLRCTAYLRLSACLFKAQKLEDAEETFLHTWLKHRKLEIDFGDQETREYLNSLSEKY